MDLKRPEQPRETASFIPAEPLDHVLREDPALSGGGTVKTILWSYPVVKDGLIYVVDIRNGLYVLRYRGPYATELRCRTLIEGNSNVGAAGAPLRPGPPPVRSAARAAARRSRCAARDAGRVAQPALAPHRTDDDARRSRSTTGRRSACRRRRGAARARVDPLPGAVRLLHPDLADPLRVHGPRIGVEHHEVGGGAGPQ